MIFINSKKDFEKYYNKLEAAYCFDDNIQFDNFDYDDETIIVDGSITCNEINAFKIKCYDIKCKNIKSEVLRCNNIDAKNIQCGYINSTGNIYTEKITCDLLFFSKTCFATHEMKIKNFRAVEKDFEIKCLNICAVA